LSFAEELVEDGAIVIGKRRHHKRLGWHWEGKDGETTGLGKLSLLSLQIINVAFFRAIEHLTAMTRRFEPSSWAIVLNSGEEGRNY
jgi:hypothetical protein